MKLIHDVIDVIQSTFGLLGGLRPAVPQPGRGFGRDNESRSIDGRYAGCHG